MREILIPPAVDDESIGLEVEFVHEALGGGVQVREEGGILWVKFCEGLHLSLRDDEHVKLVARGRMTESNQVRGLTEACDRDEEIHVDENPANEGREDPEKFLNQRR